MYRVCDKHTVLEDGNDKRTWISQLLAKALEEEYSKAPRIRDVRFTVPDSKVKVVVVKTTIDRRQEPTSEAPIGTG